MNSMTGYGRSDIKDGIREVSIEIKTVNNRYRDICIKSPHILNCIEDKIRKMIAGELGRGRIEVYIRMSGNSETARVVCDENLARGYLKALDELKTLDSMISQNIDLELLAKFPDVIKVSDESPNADELWILIEPILKDALEQVKLARAQEGSNLKADILSHLELIEKGLNDINRIKPEAYQRSKDNLKARIEKALEETSVDQTRLLTEIALLADRLAIDEETARLDSHLKRLRKMSDIDEEPIGRKLDFLVQEINREINTIGSKTDAIEISDLVVELKGETEKIREQVQNIE